MAGGNKTTTTATSEPYAAFKPMLDQVGKDLPGLYGRGGFAPVYTGSTVVPYSQQTMGGFKGTAAMADKLRPDLKQGFDRLSGIVDQGGYNNSMFKGISGMQGFAQGSNPIGTGRIDALGNGATANPYQSGYRGFAGGSGDVSANRMASLGRQAQDNPMASLFDAMSGGSQDISSFTQRGLATSAVNNPALAGFRQLAGQTGPSYSEQNLSSIARGDLLNRGDPNFDRIMERATQKAADSVAAQAGSMGRYGGGTHQAAVAREIGDLTAREELARYDRERAAQMAANAQLDQFRLADDASRMSALSGLGNTYATGQGQALNAANAASQIASGNRDARMQAGQIGSGIYQTGLNQAMGAAGNVANIQSGNQDRRMRGLDAAANDFRSGLGQGLQAAGMSAGIQSGNRDRQMNAISQLFDMGQAGVNNRINTTNAMGSAYQNLMNSYQPQFNYGSAMEDLYGRQLNDQIRIEQGQQNQGLDSLRNLMGLFGGGQFASQTQTAQGPNNTASNIAGLGLGGLSLLGGGLGWW